MRYHIFSRDGVPFGTYPGNTPSEALQAMCADGAGEYGSPEVGTEDDWDIRQADYPLSDSGAPYTGMSAEVAVDGPAEQAIAELRAIVRACEGWGTPEAQQLLNDAQEYLADLETYGRILED